MIALPSNRLRAAALIACFATIAAPYTAAMANPTVATHSAVYVERLQDDETRHLEPAEHLSRGDRVVTVVNWARTDGQTTPFVITNPLPTAIAYQGSAEDEQVVSVDGGQTWGSLDQLRVGSRHATPEDVTHVRWRIAEPNNTCGQIAYSGIVR